MRMPIQKKIRDTLNDDPWMSQCIIRHYFFGNEVLKDCEGRIEWQHAMTYSGKRVNELYTILPMCHKHHKEQGKYRAEQDYFIIERCEGFGEWAAAQNKYPKSDLFNELPINTPKR